MTLPHTYTDEADHTLKVTARPGPRLVAKMLLPTDDEQGVIEHVASVTAPKGAEAVALAKAILEAAGDTGCVVIAQAEIDRLRARVAELEERQRGVDRLVADTAVSMRERAAHVVRQRDYAGHGEDNAAIIDRLPLLPGA